MRGKLAMIGAAVLAAAFAATGAQARDQHAAAAIQAGDFAKAEAILTAERDGRWTRPETLLNLAHVYRQTGRADAARALYQQVMADGNVLLTAGTARPLWSHDIARAALAQAPAAATLAALR